MTEYNRTIITNNILKLMDEHHITQSDLAKIANTHQSRISKCLNGEGDFTLPQLVAIASCYNQSLDTLLGMNPKKAQSKEMSLRDVCKAINLLANMKGVKFIDVPSGERPDTLTNALLYHRDTYKSLYFSNVLYDIPLTYNRCNCRINDFMGKMINLLNLKLRNELAPEDYDYLINKHIDALPNKTVHQLIEESENNDLIDDELPFPGIDNELPFS